MPGIYIQTGQSIRSDSDNYYRILQFLGNGANAYAYRCLCTSGNNRGIEFVLKIQYNLSTEMRRERFFRESAFLRTCNHPAILTQFDQGTYTTSQERFPFIITNYMPETLKDRMDSGEIPFDSKVKYACQLLSAIGFLQSENIIHRDIKPSNIFISNENAILGDFGLIKRLEESSQTATEDDIDLVNTTVMNDLPGYVAMARHYRTPELVNYANRRDHLYLESDVFQLGLVLSEMFTGVNPLRPATSILSSIELDDVGYVITPHSGRIIQNTLKQMLKLNRTERITINLALSRFTSIYSSHYENYPTFLIDKVQLL